MDNCDNQISIIGPTSFNKHKTQVTNQPPSGRYWPYGYYLKKAVSKSNKVLKNFPNCCC